MSTSTSAASSKSPSPVVWFEVIGQHADKLRSFYGELFGWRFEVQQPMNYGVVEWKEGDPGIPGGIGQAAPDQPGRITFYAEVPDIDAAIEQAKGLGSQVLMPVTQLPDTKIAVISDPEGHPVGLSSRS